MRVEQWIGKDAEGADHGVTNTFLMFAGKD
jgi:hypothetical protein